MSYTKGEWQILDDGLKCGSVIINADHYGAKPIGTIWGTTQEEAEAITEPRLTPPPVPSRT